jgi:hypothetical protein
MELKLKAGIFMTLLDRHELKETGDHVMESGKRDYGE